MFILDPLLTMVSVLSQAEAPNSEVLETISKMEDICAENDIPDGTQLLVQAYTMKSIIFIRENKDEEAKTILVEAFKN